MLLKLNDINISTECNRLKNPNWREANQLTIYKNDQELNWGLPRNYYKAEQSERDLKLRLSNHSDMQLPTTITVTMATAIAMTITITMTTTMTMTMTITMTMTMAITITMPSQ